MCSRLFAFAYFAKDRLKKIRKALEYGTLWTHYLGKSCLVFFWMDGLVIKNEGQVLGQMMIRYWKWFMGLINQSRAVWGGVPKRNSSAFTFRAHNQIEHMFTMSWLAFMSAKDHKIHECKQKWRLPKLKIHVCLCSSIMLRTGFKRISHFSSVLLSGCFQFYSKPVTLHRWDVTAGVEESWQDTSKFRFWLNYFTA